jgi:hypothetical protein
VGTTRKKKKLQYKLASSGSEYSIMGEFCKNGNEPQGSVKGRNFLGELGEYLFLKKGSLPHILTSILELR